MKIQRHRIDTNVVVGLLVREFCCSGTDVSAKVLAMYADTRTPSMEPQWLATGLSQTVVENGKVYETLALPIMGLMSDVGFENVNEALQRMIQKAHQMGVASKIDPFVTLSFLALPVIPELRITPRGICKMTAKGPAILS